MATTLAARCPACATVFRVVPDQLRVSAGWVRCGRCAEVFDASATLIDAVSGAIVELPEIPAATQLPDAVPDDPVAATSEPDTDAPPEGATVEPGDPVANDERAILAGVPEAEAAAPIAVLADDPPPPLDARADPDDQPSFLRRAERAARWRQPRVRAALWATTLVGALALALQAAYALRSPMAARWPAARPVLEATCATLGCTLDAVRSIDSLAVESSGLVRVERSSLYRLAVTLRNRSDIEVAMPHLDLSLTDAQGRLVARRVIAVAEMGAPQATLAAGRDLALHAHMQTGTSGGEPVAGYTIELFYP